MPWSIQHPEPSNAGEPQSVRDTWDKTHTAQAEAEADAELEAALSEIEL